MTTAILLLLAFWTLIAALLWLGKKNLFKKTWNEPYIKEQLLLIESDDWGPGGDFHADRLQQISDILLTFKDSKNRPAVMTGDMVLSVPDLKRTLESNDDELIRNTLDKDFPDVLKAFRTAMSQGTFVPQLHGYEHLYGEGLLKLAKAGDPRVRQAATTEHWWDWETLDSPLQGHYVDGTSLPTRAHDATTQKKIVETACELFEQCFGFASQSTVAPCYLWVDDTEDAWLANNIRIIQSAGYRCPGRREDGSYLQDWNESRPGDRNARGQLYLVRNAMYEPVDGRKEDDCITQIQQAFAQATPATISTHRYNYTRSQQECDDSLQGLKKILQYCTTTFPQLRFCSSPELGSWLLDESPFTNPADKQQWPAPTAVTGWKKTGPFLKRLWYRHQKIRQIATVTGLIIPAWLLSRLLKP